MAKQSEGAAKKPSLIKHIISFIFMIGLTGIAFYLVMFQKLDISKLLPVLLVLALIQVLLQLFTFMHLDQKGSAYYTLFMVIGIFIAVISAIGIVLM